MGRELKRVHLNWEFPLKKTWPGYLNPYHWLEVKCPHCKSGHSKEYQKLSDQWYGYEPFKPEDRGSVPFGPRHPAVWKFAERNVTHSPEYYGPKSEASIYREAKRLSDMWYTQWLHHLNQQDVDVLWEEGRLKFDFQVKPTAAQVNVWSLRGMGHDSSNCWYVVAAECQRLGYPEECAHCKGESTYFLNEEDKKKYEEWEEFDPPAGEGYQLWETVSEGSPVTPIFKTPEELADYLVAKDDSVTRGTTREQWLKFINGPGWAPSMVSDGSGVKVGVQVV